MLSNGNDLLKCRVCGLVQAEPPWGHDGTDPTFGICDCCGVEFGYGDISKPAVVRFRTSWLANGAKWRDPKARPTDWNLEDQLAGIPEQWRDGTGDDRISGASPG
jgi:hypothetical protein